LKDVCEYYFQNCSIMMDSEQFSVLAGTFANAGTCPLTKNKIFDDGTCKDVLTIMYSCGMYNESGEFAFSIGIPAKSGVGGGIWCVVPGVAGFCVYSPRLGE